MRPDWHTAPAPLTMRAAGVGLREFMVEVMPGTVSDTVSFIASRSATPPDWESKVKDNPALMSRKLDKNRLIYFSITDQYQFKPSSPNPADHVVDLSQRAAQQTEAEYMATAAPGIMVPNNHYYVHAYQNEAPLGTPLAITTEPYPDKDTLPKPLKAGEDLRNGPGGQPSLIAHLWGMDAWKRDKTDPEADTKLRTIELKAGETSFLPVRLSWPAWNPTGCLASSFVSVQPQKSGAQPAKIFATRGLDLDSPYGFRDQLRYPSSATEIFFLIQSPNIVPKEPGIQLQYPCFDTTGSGVEPSALIYWDVTKIPE